MIYERVDAHDFVQAFDRMGRGDAFTIAARRELFDHIENLSNDIGQDIELDVIEICTEWSEYTDQELIDEYGRLIEKLMDTSELDTDQLIDELTAELEAHTTIIRVSGDRYLVQNF